MPYHNPNQNVVTTAPSTTTATGVATTAVTTTTATTTTTTNKPCNIADMNYIAGFTVAPIYIVLQQQSIPVPGPGGITTFLNLFKPRLLLVG